MWRFLMLAVVIIAVVITGFSLIDRGDGDVAAQAILQVPPVDSSGYTRAYEPREWSFPRDHGSHDEYMVEWWYYIGNVVAEDGQRFGFQFTIFRRALNPEPQPVSAASEWRTRQAFMAHFSLSDLDNGDFYHEERYARGGAGMAGALPNNTNPDAAFRVWLEDWQAYALNDEATVFKIEADGGDFAVDLTLDQGKPYVLQGTDGLSQKSDEPGNASQYYSLTRLLTDGTITINGETFTVAGNAWMDREFSTSALGDDAQGWDWFALQFDDGRELVVGQIRLKEGGARTAYTGTMVYEDGSYRQLNFDEYEITPTATWESPHTGAVYPSGWTITVAADVVRAENDFALTITPLMADQELSSGDIAYWEGAVRISGDATGYGYAELTGYVDSIAGRF